MTVANFIHLDEALLKYTTTPKLDVSLLGLPGSIKANLLLAFTLL